MATEVTSIRLPPKDATIIDHFVTTGEFKSRSEFMRYAVKKTICELVLKEFHEKLGKKGASSKKECSGLLSEIDKIRTEMRKELKMADDPLFSKKNVISGGKGTNSSKIKDTLYASGL